MTMSIVSMRINILSLDALLDLLCSNELCVAWYNQRQSSVARRWLSTFAQSLADRPDAALCPRRR